MRNNRYIWFILLCWAVLAPVQAQEAKAWSYLSLSLSGGEGNTLCMEKSVKDKMGADAQVRFSYELEHRFFFFNFGVGAQYGYTRQGLLPWTDAFSRTDKDHELHSYQYCYSDYQERQHTVAFTVPVQLGFYMTEQFYMAVGATFSLPLVKQYAGEATFHTQGVYPWAQQPFQNVPAYGFYTWDIYKDKGNYHSMQYGIAPTLEIGYDLPHKTDRYFMRIGAYAEYNMVIGNWAKSVLVDYSAVDANPSTLSQENLKANLRLNSVLDSERLSNPYARMAVGVRFTVLFDVTHQQKICVICDD